MRTFVARLCIRRVSILLCEGQILLGGMLTLFKDILGALKSQKSQKQQHNTVGGLIMVLIFFLMILKEHLKSPDCPI